MTIIEDQDLVFSIHIFLEIILAWAEKKRLADSDPDGVQHSEYGDYGFLALPKLALMILVLGFSFNVLRY